jgi:hypothetical protein
MSLRLFCWERRLSCSVCGLPEENSCIVKYQTVILHPPDLFGFFYINIDRLTKKTLIFVVLFKQCNNYEDAVIFSLLDDVPCKYSCTDVGLVCTNQCRRDTSEFSVACDIA